VKPALLLALASGAAFAATPFSHRLHLEMGLDCTGCHAAAATSTRADDNLLPEAQVCRGCHAAGIVPQRPPALATPVTKFNHALHLKMGSITAPLIAKTIDLGNYLQPWLAADVRAHLNSKNPCEACHRGLEESDAVTPAALPNMADCLVCHGKIDLPWTCEDCHSKTSNLTPASHKTDHFFDLHSRGNLQLDKTTCAVCHGREFTCMGCH
jgi:predicted CXXCH cytochrome family protein